MPILRVPKCGSVGVVKDMSRHETQMEAWTDAQNMRFLDGSCRQFFGHGPAYGLPTVVPYHVLPIIASAGRFWIYASDKKIYVTTITGGAATHTNLTRQTAGNDVDYTAQPNQWTSTTLSGIPILNPGNTVDPPQRWNLDPAQRCVTLDNWPAGTYCKSLRAYKNFLVALNITRGGQSLPYMVKWSTAADPGAVPSTWDTSDATQLAGEVDLAAGGDPIVDALELGDSLMIYKEQSVWRMSFIGGQDVMGFQKVLGMSGAMNRNCIVEIDGRHVVLTGSDVIVHDGQSATSVLDHVARRALFQDFDTAYTDRAFLFKNPFLNEVFICYVSIGYSRCNRALVWNYRENTVTYRTLPNLYHASYGTVDTGLGGTWEADNDRWDTDLTAWNGPDFTPNTTRVLMASADQRLLLLDASASFNGELPVSYVEKRGIGFGQDETIKMVRGVRLRAEGNLGETITVKVGSQEDPWDEPVYTTATHTIGSTVKCDFFVSGRYIALYLGSGTAAQFRIDSYDLDIVELGKW